jgi:adenylate cyclase
MKRSPLRPALVARAFHALRAQLSTTLRDPRFRLRAESGLAVALALSLILSILLFSGIFMPLDPLLTDLLYQPMQPSGQVVIIAIDQKSIDAVGTFPWNRTIYANLLEQLSVTPPRVIAFDLPFSQSAPEDSGLAGAIQKSGNVLLTTVAVQPAAYPARRETLPQFDVVLLPAPDLLNAAAGVGHRLLVPDHDNILRRVPVAIAAANVRYPALGLAAAQAYLSSQNIEYDLAGRQVTIGNRRIQVDEYGRMLLNFTGARAPIPTYSYSDVFTGHVPASTFAGKIVFIGGTSDSEPDTYTTPITSADEALYNVDVEADLADMLVSTPPHLLRQQSTFDQIAVTLLFALIAGLTLPHIRPIYSLALTFIYLVGLLLFAFDSFNHGLIVRILYPALALILTFGAIATFRYFSEERRRQFLATLFRRYVPSESVGRVVEAVDSGELPLSGVRRIVTVLYADLRGFSSLSEGLAPEAVLDLVNRYLELMMAEIQKENGTISKPMGDALVAIWNAPLDQPDHAPRAIHAAINIRRSLLRFHKNNLEERALNVGLGLATGWSILGNISALGKVEYTLVGETVNVASRISAFAGTNQILADAPTALALPAEIEKRELQPVRIRGRKEALPIWEIRDTAEVIMAEEDEFGE